LWIDRYRGGKEVENGQRGGPGGLHISVEQPSAGLIVVSPAGELDLSNGEAFSEAIAVARAKGATALVLDLTALTFMDSSGLRILLDAWNESQLADRKLTLVVRKDGLVRRVLEISGCDGVFPIVDQLADAV
jgi:anti-sigma B factor antagonist